MRHKPALIPIDKRSAHLLCKDLIKTTWSEKLLNKGSKQEPEKSAIGTYAMRRELRH